MQDSRLTEIIPWLCISPICCQDPVFSPPEFPHLTSSPSAVAAMADGRDIFCLLIGQETFHFSYIRFCIGGTFPLKT